MNLIAASQLDSSELILSIRALIMPAGLYWLKDSVSKCKGAARSGWKPHGRIGWFNGRFHLAVARSIYHSDLPA
jgi:hypothetical protein